MTIVYSVNNFSDESGKIMSQNDLDKLNKANVYNVRVDNMKKSIGLTPEEILLLVNSGDYNEIHIQEVYNRVQGLAEKTL